MEILETRETDNHDKILLEIASGLFFDNISIDRLRGLSEKDKEKIKYYYGCLERGEIINYPSLSEENNIKMTA